MTIILGNNVHVFLDTVEIFCAKDCVLTESKDTVEMAGQFELPGIWTYNRLQRRSWKVDCSGLTKVNSTDGQLDYFSIINTPYATDFHDLLITWEDQEGNTVSFIGTVFIPKSSITGPAREFAGSQVSLIGTGPYHLSTETSGSGSGIPCVPVGTSGSFDPPDGELNTPYSYTLALTGTNPKTLGAFSGNPGWMTISVATGDLVLGGTPTTYPDDAGTFFLDIIVNNDCGSIHFIDEFGATIDATNYRLNAAENMSIDSVTGTGVPALGSTGTNGSLTGHHTAMSGSYSVSLSGTPPFTVNLQALVDGSPVDSVSVSGGGTYGLNITASEAQEVIITIVI